MDKKPLYPEGGSTMRRAATVWIILACSFLLIGCIILGGVMAMLNWDFTKLSTDKFETNEYIIQEAYENISVTTDTADLVLVPSESEKSTVVCFEQKNVRHSVAVKDGTLVIAAVDTRKWYEHIGIHFSTPKITVSIPQGTYGTLSVTSVTGDVEIPGDFQFANIDISENTGNVTNLASASENIKIKATTGNIRVEGVFANTLDLSVSTGKITVSGVTCSAGVLVNVSTGKTKLTKVTCQNLTSGGTTGTVSLTDVIAAGTLSIHRSTGDITFDGCDAAEIFAKTSTGKVVGSLLTQKVFITNTDTGKIKVPNTTTGGRCEITTNTGDIKITIQKP